MAAELRGDADAIARVALLVRDAQQGRREAFDILIQRYLSDMFRLAAAIAGPDDGRDAAQDAFVAAWRDLPRLRKPERFEFWLRRIVVHRAQNAIRSRRRHPATSLERSRPEATDVTAPGDFRDVVDAREALDGAFGTLSPDQRAVVVLHYGAGYTLTEIAGLTRARPGTVKSRLHAALERLRQVVSEGAR